MPSEQQQQQLADEIYEAIVYPDKPHGMDEQEYYENVADAAAKAAEPFLVAAYRAGYERCKRDAEAAIKARFIEVPQTSGDAALNMGMDYALAAVEQLAVVAALDATQTQGGRDG